MKWQEQKQFLQGQLNLFPQWLFELPSKTGQFPVAYFANVGVVGWVLPKVAIIDGYGLNDYVIARLPAEPRIKRRMAHDRFAPQAYVASFLPNVSVMAYEKFWDYKLVKQLNIPDSLIPFPTTRK